MEGFDPVLIGIVEGFYRVPGVASIRLHADITTGERLHFQGATTDFEQNIESMEINHRQVTRAPKGALVGIKVSCHARKNDHVYRVGERR